MHRPQAVRAMVGVSVAPNLPSTVITYEIFLAPLKFGGLHAIGHLSFFVHMVSRSDFPAVRASHGKARIKPRCVTARSTSQRSRPDRLTLC